MSSNTTDEEPTVRVFADEDVTTLYDAAAADAWVATEDPVDLEEMV
ncbi:hypothetical protein [Natronomonas sp. EA1]